MSGLNDYIGKYRVLAEYDLDTNDFPRDYDGNIDSSFDDYYIKCKQGTKILHVARTSNFACLIPSKGRGNNILRKMVKEKTGLEIIDSQKAADYLFNNGFLYNIEILDDEVYFEFKKDLMEYICTLVGASTYGASIRPLSVKNLPKERYVFPEKDMKKYKEARGKFTKGDTDKLVKLNCLNKKFDKEVLIKKCGKNYKIEMKKIKLNDRLAYIHYKGLWDEYVEFIKERMMN